MDELDMNKCSFNNHKGVKSTINYNFEKNRNRVKNYMNTQNNSPLASAAADIKRGLNSTVTDFNREALNFHFQS
jgi:hypothetical protein